MYVLDYGELGLTRRLASKCRLPLCVLASCLVASGSATLSPAAAALSLGAEQVTSYLGQPLRLSIPLLGTAGDSLDARCFRVVSPERTDGLTTISQGRIELQISPSPPRLIVRSNRSVDDPVVRISVEAGCDSPIRRDYTLLLDPPPTQAVETARPAPAPTPPVSADANLNFGSAARPLPPANTSPDEEAQRRERALAGRANAAAAKANARALANKLDKVPKASLATSSTPRAQPKSVAKEQDQLRVQDGAGQPSAAVADASLAALAVPRLKIASDLPSFEPSATGTKFTDELQAAIAVERRARLLNAPIEEDLSPRLEADLVVAKRRLAELQSQLSTAGIAAKSDPTAVAAAGLAGQSNSGISKAAAPPAVQADWNWRQWLWIPGLLLVLGLIGFLLRQRRLQRQAPPFAAAPAVHGVSDEAVFAPTLADIDTTAVPLSNAVTAVGRPVQLVSAAAAESPGLPSSRLTDKVAAPSPAPFNPLSRPPATVNAEREASDRLNNPLFQLRDTTRHVDVTELSQVTDEAQVYVDLGRNDQAIEILRDHIENQQGERDSPAAWLMIFDLYRRTNNRAGYDELAPKFRTHFNGRMPDWDSYGHELALDDGLEAFPHLVAVLQRDWGTSEARKFLEELLYDNRGGSRLGFSLAAYRDILLLLQVHEAFDSLEPNDLASIIDWESRGANDDDGTPKWDLSLEMLEPPKVGELESFLRNRPADDKS